MESGYYYTWHLASNGEPLTEMPEVVWYDSKRNAIDIIGCEFDFDYNTDNWKILGKVPEYVFA